MRVAAFPCHPGLLWPAISGVLHHRTRPREEYRKRNRFRSARRPARWRHLLIAALFSGPGQRSSQRMRVRRPPGGLPPQALPCNRAGNERQVVLLSIAHRQVRVKQACSGHGCPLSACCPLYFDTVAAGKLRAWNRWATTRCAVGIGSWREERWPLRGAARAGPNPGAASVAPGRPERGEWQPAPRRETRG